MGRSEVDCANVVEVVYIMGDQICWSEREKLDF